MRGRKEEEADHILERGEEPEEGESDSEIQRLRSGIEGKRQEHASGNKVRISKAEDGGGWRTSRTFPARGKGDSPARERETGGREQ